MKLICFKLVSGDELIAKVETEDDDWLNVTDPVKLTHEYDPYGEYGLKFISFMPYNEGILFTFHKKYVITVIEPSDKMISYYSKFLLASEEKIFDSYQPSSNEIH